MNESIKKAIELKGNQRELAAACGVSQYTVSLWLRGKRKPTSTHVARLCAASGGLIHPLDIRPDLDEIFKLNINKY